MSKVFGAKVKSVLSADTLVLTPLNGSSNQERLLSLAYLQAPRLASNEKYAFESRELLRTLLVGKEIKFWVIYKNQSEREFGDVSTPIFSSLIEYVLEKGAAKLRDNLNIFDDEDLLKLKQIESKAQAKDVGLWNPKLRSIQMATELSSRDIEKSQSSPINAIIEKVISGDRLLIRFLLSDSKQAVLPILLAGIRCPRSSSPDQEGEPFGEEAKNYVEGRLLAKSIKISIVGESSSGALVGNVIHPAGNIAEKLLEEGLAEVSDWQSSIIGSSGMSSLRKLEKVAKNSHKNLWKSTASDSKQVSSTDSSIETGKTYNATVARVLSSDTMTLRLKNDSEITVQLASLRAPRQSDIDFAAFVPAAREFVRSKLIGKQIKFTVESFRPKTEQYDERAMVTILSNEGQNFSEFIVSNGYASVIKGFKKGEDRPAYWDELIECENQAIKSKKGIYGKIPEAERTVDISENASRSKPYLFSFQNRSKIPGIVEHISSANRFRISLPKEGLRLMLVLGGLSSTGSKDDSISKQALEFANKRAYQRDVHLDIYNVDKIGGFIGNLYLPGSNTPFQVSLLQNGFAECHEYSLSQTKFGSQMLEAEREAKSKKLGLWKNYDPLAEAEKVPELTKNLSNLKIDKKYLDVTVTEILEGGLVAFQILDEAQKKLTPFMLNFHSQSASFSPLLKAPKSGDIVAAKYSDNGKYYRARVLSHTSSPASYKVQHIDFGTTESLPLSSLRSLPSQFSTQAYPGQVHIAQLSLIKLPPKQPTDYETNAIYLLEDLALDKTLVVAQTHANPAPGVEMDVELYDPEVIATDPSWNINKELVKQGMAIVKKVNLTAYEKLLDTERKELLDLESQAKRAREGCWEYGDIEGDESLI
ncbi:hypothetical protein CANARDRAFT_30522 [[Candida] arabinofermentans NRRL YB-2248]|uniref:Uncharacterized protein n=1 Tax=[Candida] arabinofermentans NRRL YB-2248 TaxID=983967 RepID=A0A1E4STH3_9ASCO|nr:hypothetical protein CANARDRAFT_30522 [[Candida] arabinofermentans NRRL YB-2248]